MTENNKDFTGTSGTERLRVGGENNPYVNYGLLAYVAAMIDRFPSIRDLVVSTNINTATLFTAQVISTLDGEISRNPGVIHDSYLLIDLINIYSLETNVDVGITFDLLVNAILKTRSVDSSDILISEEALDHYTVENSESFKTLVSNNKVLVALYVYLLAVNLF